MKGWPAVGKEENTSESQSLTLWCCTATSRLHGSSSSMQVNMLACASRLVAQICFSLRRKDG